MKLIRQQLVGDMFTNQHFKDKIFL